MERPPSLLRPAGSAPRKTRVLIVDDSLVVRTVLSRIVDAEGDLEVVAKATTAEMALQRLQETQVDVILLDLEMPGMGGIGALPKILATAKHAKVLVVSSLTRAGAEATLEALSIGAADTLLKPRAGEFDAAYARTLVARIRALAPSGGHRKDRLAAPALQVRVAPFAAPAVVAVGASTGGIHALCLLLGALPRSFTAPILVVQHLPASFMETLARQASTSCGRPAVVAEAGMTIEPGRIHVAPGEGHLVVRRERGALVAGIARHPTPSGCTPSVDPTFESLADAAGNRALGVVLSGMGRDGAIGAERLVRAGGTIFAQDAATSAVWGMPRAVVEAGLASAVLPPEQLGQRIGSLYAASAGLGASQAITA